MQGRNGKLTTKDGSNTLNVENVTVGGAGWWADIVGDPSSRRNYFTADYWSLVEVKPSPYEQVQALPSGTMFRTGNKNRTYVRLPGDEVAYWYDGEDQSYVAHNADKDYWGPGDVTVVEP